MAQNSLGLDINDHYLSGVVVEQQGKRAQILARGSVLRQDGPEALGEALGQLLTELEWQGGRCVCGVPQSMVSVRNLTLPFVERRKIEQALPYELDDQLIQPIEELVTSYQVTDLQGAESQIMALATPKKELALLLGQLQQHGLDPEILLPSVLPMFEAVSRRFGSRWLLVVHGDLSALSVGLLYDGSCRLYRRLPYPELLELHSPFALVQGEVRLVSLEAGQQCCAELIPALQRSIDLFRQNRPGVGEIEDLVVGGTVGEEPTLCTLIGSGLGLVPEKLDLGPLLGLESDQRSPGPLDAHHERAVALALYGPEKRASYNFRSGEFATRGRLLASRKKVLSAGVMGLLLLLVLTVGGLVSNRQLAGRNQELRQRMTTLYQGIFPRATRIQDPYVQLKVAVQEMERSETTVPVYAGKRQVLALLADISARIPEELSLQVTRMVIDQQAVRMRGVTGTFNNVDAIKNHLSASAYYSSVAIVSATADKKSNKIRFELQLELGEG
ncbi:type II secretion system protein GspL [Desulfogranum mediterraneum]|uniref:type II secretion system protein GspL n=1 Tax=Desulfogranum mediterraneum TaxID=160661 RepID=UPI00041487D9|nr:type II secretion system protein GspL [Desulfogranum mediterraneum]